MIIIYQDITAAMKNLTPPIELENKALQDYVDLINAMDSEGDTFDEKFYHAVKCLWSDAGVQRSYSRSNEYHLLECAK